MRFEEIPYLTRTRAKATGRTDDKRQKLAVGELLDLVLVHVVLILFLCLNGNFKGGVALDTGNGNVYVQVLSRLAGTKEYDINTGTYRLYGARCLDSRFF